MHWSRQGLEYLNVALMLLNVITPVLDCAHGRHCVTDPEQCIEGISLAAREWVLKENDRQVSSIGDDPEMFRCYLGARLGAIPPDYR